MTDLAGTPGQTSEGGASLDWLRKQQRAHAAVALAVRAGTLVRGTCEVCGAGKTDAHHDDYDEPLNVRWLCRLHHRQAHAQVPKADRRGTVTLRSLRRRIPDEPTWIATVTEDGTYETLGLWIPAWLVDE